jgi:hypothetical protein
MTQHPTNRHYPDWLTAYIRYSSYTEAPENMRFWVGVSTIAGALRRRVWIDQRYFKWIPNFYIIIVAPPGIVSKSTTANVGMDLLRQIPGVNFGPEVVTWPALAKAFAASAELVLDPSTGEHMPMSCFTISSSEFGNLLDTGDPKMIDLLVHLWDGLPLKKETKTQGTDSIPNPFINVVACTTPSWIEQNFPEYMIGGGFMSRCIFVYAEKKAKLVAYPKLLVPEDFAEERIKLIEDLNQIANMVGEMQLSDSAMSWGIEWYRKHYEIASKGMTDDRFGGYIARKQVHIHKIAMVLAASRSNSLTIEQSDLEKALQLIEEVEPTMIHVFDRIGRTRESQSTFDLLKFIEKKGEVPLTQLYAMCLRFLPRQDMFDQAFQQLIRANLVTVENRESVLWVRKK